MNNLSVLIKGELQRLQKYNVTLMSLIVAIIWSGLLFFIEDMVLFQTLLPFVIMLDVTLMSVMYTGAVMYYEKSENTMFSLLVTPVSHASLIFSKVIANVIHQTLSTGLVIILFVFLKDIEVSWFIILIMMLSIALHTLIGFIFTYTAKDFTSMLTNFMFVMIVFVTPTLLLSLHIISSANWLNYVLLLSPVEQASQMIQGVMLSQYHDRFFMSILLSVLYIGILYRWIVLPQFSQYVQKGSGV
jgi:fluoroquinolone transport system permease protein